jgi:ABC-type dipeptide/oligopeptide/nickel transport system permease component
MGPFPAQASLNREGVPLNLGKFIERLVHLVPVLLGVSVIVFLMMAATPGDPVEIMLGDQQATAEQRVALRHDMGLDLPLPQRFGHFLKNAATGDFGMSYFHRRPVSQVILERMPATIELTLVALVVALLVAIPLGVLAAVKKNTLFDRIATLASLMGISLPGFWFGLLLILFFGVTLQILPVSGRSDLGSSIAPVTHFLLIDTLLVGNLEAFRSTLAHLIMPALTLGLPMAAVLMRVMRTSMLEVLRQDYVTFAEAKGLAPTRVLFLHALKNALIPTVTVAALEVGSLLGGSMIVETVFGWPGLGRVVVESIFTRNYPLIQAAILLYAVTYVLLNFLADILYTVLNPRVRL